MISPKIVWEKWVDPFGKDTEEAKWTDYNNDLDAFDYEGEKDDVDDYDEEKTAIKIPSNPIKVIASPLGLIPYNEHTASSKIFNFWLGHTNFNISHRVKKVIEETEGVEILDVFTRYRFRIAVGKCFEDAEVMNGITKEIISLYDES
jgi:hypothetical protein